VPDLLVPPKVPCTVIEIRMIFQFGRVRVHLNCRATPAPDTVIPPFVVAGSIRPSKIGSSHRNRHVPVRRAPRASIRWSPDPPFRFGRVWLPQPFNQRPTNASPFDRSILQIPRPCGAFFTGKLPSALRVIARNFRIPNPSAAMATHRPGALSRIDRANRHGQIRILHDLDDGSFSSPCPLRVAFQLRRVVRRRTRTPQFSPLTSMTSNVCPSSSVAAMKIILGEQPALFLRPGGALHPPIASTPPTTNNHRELYHCPVPGQVVAHNPLLLFASTDFVFPSCSCQSPPTR